MTRHRVKLESFKSEREWGSKKKNSFRNSVTNRTDALKITHRNPREMSLVTLKSNNLGHPVIFQKELLVKKKNIDEG